MKKLVTRLPEIVKGVAEKYMVDAPDVFARVLPEYIGAYGGALLQIEIAQLVSPPLSQTTLMIRRTRQVNRTYSTKPLIDTGTMRLAVTWKVSTREKSADPSSRPPAI